MTLIELFSAIRADVLRYQPSAETATLQFASPRPGDVEHSFASIERARGTLGYEPSHDVARGLSDTIAWYAPRLIRAIRRNESGTIAAATSLASP